MNQTLPQVAHDHHQRLTEHIDRMPAVADALLVDPAPAVRAAVVEMGTFISGTLVPHVDAAEKALYPELERMFQNRHSMAPMRREHDEIRRLAGDYGRLGAIVADGHVTLGNTLALRRVMFQLYALVKVHLAEEEAYLRMMDKGVSSDLADVIAAALEHPVA